MTNRSLEHVAIKHLRELDEWLLFNWIQNNIKQEFGTYLNIDYYQRPFRLTTDSIQAWIDQDEKTSKRLCTQHLVSNPKWIDKIYSMIKEANTGNVGMEISSISSFDQVRAFNTSQCSSIIQEEFERLPSLNQSAINLQDLHFSQLDINSIKEGEGSLKSFNSEEVHTRQVLQPTKSIFHNLSNILDGFSWSDSKSN